MFKLRLQQALYRLLFSLDIIHFIALNLMLEPTYNIVFLLCYIIRSFPVFVFFFFFFFSLKILKCLLFLFHILNIVFILNLQAEIVVSPLVILHNFLNSVVFGLVTIKTTTKQLSTVCEL